YSRGLLQQVPPTSLKKPAAKATKRLVDNFKDRVKARKFMQMMKDGLIPCAAQEAYNRCSGRAEQTRLINSLFVLEGKKLVIQPKFTVPKEYTRTQDQETEDKATYRKNGFGKLIFNRMYSLTQEDLDQALSTGEVICWKSGGLTLYAAVNQEFKNSSAKNSKDSLCTGRVELDSLAGESFAKVFDAMTPSIEVSNPPGSSKQTNRPSSSQLLAWQKATSQSLSRSQSELESACVWLEIDGKPLTRQSLQNFLTMQKNVALSCQEKIAGFTACLKSRSM
ncbi:unnamed protein product, partial [Effrenium voratum]